MKTEIWNGYSIRFVEADGEWWAVAKDIADALDYVRTNNMTKLIPDKYLMYSILEHMNAKSVIVSEFGIYKAIFGSHKPEAEDFQEWVFNVIRSLREASGLQAYQVFRMLDKEHQKQTMAKLSQSLNQPARVDFIKANTIANKAVSTRFGYPKMIKKADMTPEMLVDREPILEDAAQLTADKRNFDLDFHVGQAIYKKYPKKVV